MNGPEGFHAPTRPDRTLKEDYNLQVCRTSATVAGAFTTAFSACRQKAAANRSEEKLDVFVAGVYCTARESKRGSRKAG